MNMDFGCTSQCMRQPLALLGNQDKWKKDTEKLMNLSSHRDVNNYFSLGIIVLKAPIQKPDAAEPHKM